MQEMLDQILSAGQLPDGIWGFGLHDLTRRPSFWMVTPQNRLPVEHQNLPCTILYVAISSAESVAKENFGRE